MKKGLAVVLCFVMLLSFAACGSDKGVSLGKLPDLWIYEDDCRGLTLKAHPNGGRERKKGKSK